MKVTRVLMLFLLGCGAPAASSTAPADCDAFVAANYCPAVVTCLPQLTEADCIAAAKTALNCASAVGESSALPACKQEIASSTCDVLVDTNGDVTLPASCNGVFQVP